MPVLDYLDAAPHLLPAEDASGVGQSGERLPECFGV